jgi:nitrite reductase/ring-hydroxylating ferredoxin subunit
MPNAADPELQALCNSADLQNGGRAVPFDVVHAGQTCRAFAIRYQGQAHAYLNRCSHVAMEMDWQPDRFFDETGRWLVCATHGATYEPDTGACQGGPCRGGLVKIELVEQDGVIHWRAQYPFQPLAF